MKLTQFKKECMNLRKIDALVAEHIFEEPVYWPDGKNSHPWQNTYNKRRTDTTGIEVVPPYSSDISAAWEVLEKLRFIQPEGTNNGSGSWVLSPLMEGGYDMYYKHTSMADYESTFCDTYADSAPLAICLAALRTKGVEP